MDEPSQDGNRRAAAARELTLHLDAFAWDAASEESHRLGITLEDLARFSLLYYLADLDSGRIARRLPRDFAFQDS